MGTVLHLYFCTFVPIIFVLVFHIFFTFLLFYWNNCVLVFLCTCIHVFMNNFLLGCICVCIWLCSTCVLFKCIVLVFLFAFVLLYFGSFGLSSFFYFCTFVPFYFSTDVTLQFWTNIFYDFNHFKTFFTVVLVDLCNCILVYLCYDKYATLHVLFLVCSCWPTLCTNFLCIFFLRCWLHLVSFNCT